MACVACVRYWAAAREVAGRTEQTVAAESLAQVLVAISAEHGEGMQRLLETGLVLVDGTKAVRGADQPLDESAVVEVLPPYAGG